MFLAFDKLLIRPIPVVTEVSRVVHYILNSGRGKTMVNQVPYSQTAKQLIINKMCRKSPC